MKAIIVDLDRTLLRTDKSLSAYTLRTLRKCQETGMLLLAATARPERSITTYQEQVGFGAMTAMNGARVLLPDRTLENGLPRASGEEMLARLAAVEPDALISLETSEGAYANAPIPEWNCRFYDRFPALPAGIVYKILVSRDGEPVPVENILTRDAYCTIANGRFSQIMSREATKWKGVQAMLAAFGIPPSEAVYFGDDYDDIEPIQKCGMGIAVANAIPEALASAKYIARSNDEDGVAHFLEEHLLL